MLHSDLRYDFVRTWFRRLEEASFDEIDKVYAGLVEEGRRALEASGVRHGRVRVAYAADMRYVGQEHPVTVELGEAVFRKRDRQGLKRHFDDEHLQRYGTNAPKERAEIVSLRASVAGMMKKPALERIAKGGRAPARAAAAGKRNAWFGGKRYSTPAYRRDALLAGNRIEGPALIEEHASTTVVMPGDRLRVDDFGNLVLEIDR